MRFREFLLEYRDITDPAFQKWFRGSEVVDENGKPLIVYHGTLNNGQIDVFHDMSHFGTAKAANDRIDYVSKLPVSARAPGMPGEGDEAPHVYPVYLSIKNPIDLIDFGDWSDPEFWFSIFESGYYDDVAAYMGLSPDVDGHDLIEELIEQGVDPVEWIKDNGFDGIRYQNEYEDKGSDSWIPFSGKQVVSAIDGKDIKETLMIEQRIKK